MTRYYYSRTNRARGPVGRAIIGPGAIAGITASLVMVLFWMIVSAAQGQGFFTPLQLIGAFWLAGTAMHYAFWASALGLATHLATGAVLGVIFAALTRKIEKPGPAIAAGLTFGAFVMLVMTYGVLPWANPILFATVDRGWFFLFHLAFGLTLPLALPMRSELRSRRHAHYREDAYSRP